MADKEISGLPHTTAVRSDTLIPVYQPGDTTPAQKMTGEQFSAFAKSEVRESVFKSEMAAVKAAESARNAAVYARTANDASDAVQNALDNIPSGNTLVINDLSTGGAAAALSAEMGKQLNQNKADKVGSDPLTVKIGNGFSRMFGNDYGAYFEAYANETDEFRRQIFMANKTAVENLADSLRYLEGNGNAFNLFGEHNKPNGIYGGSNSIPRTVQVGAVESSAGVLSISSAQGFFVLVTYDGALCVNSISGEVKILSGEEINYRGGNLHLNTTDAYVNYEGFPYHYQAL